MRLSETRMEEISFIAHRELAKRPLWEFPNCIENFTRISNDIIISNYKILHPNYEAIRDFKGRITAPSETGYSLYNAGNNKYMVVYNGRELYGRQLWTLAHELGHITLEHHKKAGVIYSTELYDVFEREANVFASEFLAPTPLIRYIEKECGTVSTKNIEFVFGLSGEAATYRLKDYQRDRWQGNNRDQYSLELRDTFGERVLPDKVFEKIYILPFEAAISV